MSRLSVPGGSPSVAIPSPSRDQCKDRLAVSNPSPFLSPEEVAELTGRRRVRAQVRALVLMGVRHLIRPDGRPVVPRAAVFGQDLQGQEPNGEKEFKFRFDLLR